MHLTTRLAALAALATISALGACSSDAESDPVSPPPPPIVPVMFTATGDIQATIDAFRAALGEPSNGGAAGEQAAGRREIAWDGAGANPFNNKDDFPAAFFNTNSKSGAVFTTPGTGFRNDSLKFAEVNAGYANEFSAFSPTKLFSPIGSNVMDVLFQVAGQPTPAEVTGFGAVFTDVDIAEKTTLEFFDRNGQSLGTLQVPPRSNAAGLSFAGVRFDATIIARVRITLGTGALGANVNDVSAAGTVDVVVTDNFVYGEPRSIR